jgi:exonuclease III
LTDDWAGTNVGGPGAGLNGALGSLPAQPTPVRGADTVPVPKRRRRTAKKKRTGKKTYANITVATLNMRGHGDMTTMDPFGKWKYVSALMKRKKIGILALQETHLTDKQAARLNDSYSKRLLIVNTAHPTRPNAAGVALVFNKEVIPTDQIDVTALVDGRALVATVTWHREHQLHIMAVYAPNSPSDNSDFWDDLLAAIEERALTKPDIVLGDFNVVEDPQDRLPPPC